MVAYSSSYVCALHASSFMLNNFDIIIKVQSLSFSPFLSATIVSGFLNVRVKSNFPEVLTLNPGKIFLFCTQILGPERGIFVWAL